MTNEVFHFKRTNRKLHINRATQVTRRTLVCLLQNLKGLRYAKLINKIIYIHNLYLVNYDQLKRWSLWQDVNYAM